MEPSKQHRRTFLLYGAGCVLLSILLGFAVSAPGILAWDDWSLHRHSQWLLMRFGLMDTPFIPSENGQWTAPLWALVLGIATEIIFPFLHDPYLVRHALTFALYPLTFCGLFVLLRRAGASRATAALCMALLFGSIRFAGHALTSPRDFPHASAFLLVTTGLWLMLRSAGERPGGKAFGLKNAAALGAVSVIPFLLRSPDLFHFLFTGAFLAMYVVVVPGIPLRKRLSMPVLFIFSGALCIFILSPMLWGKGIADWLHPFALFTRFPQVHSARFFGEGYSSNTLPWWYAPSWVLIGVHPSAFILAAAGWCAFLLRGRRRADHAFAMRVGADTVRISLRAWMFLVIVFAWAAYFLLMPSVYDEDRHVLFLLMPLVVFGGLGLDWLSDRSKYVLAAVVAAFSIHAYAQWGYYSYAYKSPLIGHVSSYAFMGDYRATCIFRAVDALQGLVPEGTFVVLPGGPVPEAQAHSKRRTDSLLLGRAGQKMFHFSKGNVASTWRFVTISPSPETTYSAGGTLREGTLLWFHDMPSGERACSVVLYEPEGDV